MLITITILPGTTLAFQQRLKPEQAVAAIAVVEQQWRQWRSYPPTDDEVAVAVASIRSSLQQAVDATDTRTNIQLATQLYASVRDGRTFQTPPAAGPADPDARCGYASGRLCTGASDAASAHCFGHRLGAGAAADVSDAWQASLRVPVTAPVARTADVWAYGDVPTDGVIVA